MLPAVRALASLALTFLRPLASATLLFHAHRALFQLLLSPASPCALRAAEHDVLTNVHTPLRHAYIPVEPPTPPEPNNAVFNIHVVIAGDTAKGRPLVLLHGHSMAAAYFHRNIDDLVNLGFCVYALDLPGWARSPRPPFTHPADTELTQSVITYHLAPLIAALDILSVSSFHLVAHSLGAYLAFELATQFPSRVRSLCLVAPACIQKRIPWVRAWYFRVGPARFVRGLGVLGWLAFRVRYGNDEAYVKNKLRRFAYLLLRAGESAETIVARAFVKFNGPAGVIGTEIVRPLIERIQAIAEKNTTAATTGKIRRRIVEKLHMTSPLSHAPSSTSSVSDANSVTDSDEEPLPYAASEQTDGESEVELRHPAESIRDVPIRLVAGERDSVLPLEDVQTMHECLRNNGFRSTMYVVEGTNHCPFLEAPAAFRKIMQQLV